jgi:threonine synthase
MEQLSKSGSYTVGPIIKKKLEEQFWAGYCDDAKTKLIIDAVYRKYNYLIDPHTAVGYDVLNHYRHDTGDNTIAIIASTASPYKFCDSVLEALGEKKSAEGVSLIEKLSSITGTSAPRPLTELKNKAVRFTQTTSKSDMKQVVEGFLK